MIDGNKKRGFIFFILFYHELCSKSHTVFNLIHGTWAKKSEWHKKNSDFHITFSRALKGYYKPDDTIKIDSFEWSGKLSHEARLKAGRALASAIKKMPQETDIHIIAHSHGGNIVFIASHILKAEKKSYKIANCFLFGVPINTTRYSPSMEVIGHVYNLFSLQDYVQPVLGLYDRVLPEHDRISNLRVTINGKEPGHCDFLTKSVAQWLPTLPLLQDDHDLFSHRNPGSIHFFNAKKPLYKVDSAQHKLLEDDKTKNFRMLQAFCHKNILPLPWPTCQKKGKHFLPADSDLFESLLDTSKPLQ